MNKNEDMKKELWDNIDMRKKSEQELLDLASEVERYKLSF